MQEIRRDGSEQLTAGATEQDVVRAVRDPRNVEVRVIQAGGFVEQWVKGERRRYEVLEGGKLQRITLQGKPWPTDDEEEP